MLVIVVSPQACVRGREFHTINKTGLQQNNLSSLGKLRVIYLYLTLLNLNMAPKMLYQPPLLREKGLNLKNYAFNKKNVLKYSICMSKRRSFIYVKYPT
jgi:hypothetical protein